VGSAAGVSDRPLQSGRGVGASSGKRVTVKADWILLVIQEPLIHTDNVTAQIRDHSWFGSFDLLFYY
jgi:hypothetical protein